DLCRLLRMDKSTLSRDVEVMRRNGWLGVDDTGGGRARPLRLSPEGHALLEAAVPAWRQAQGQARRLIGDDGAEAVLAMARRLRTGDTPGLWAPSFFARLLYLQHKGETHAPAGRPSDRGAAPPGRAPPAPRHARRRPTTSYLPGGRGRRRGVRRPRPPR